MVATRHSFPTTTSFTTTTTSSEPPTAEPTGTETYSKKQLALLKQLNIDAKDAILDGSRSGGGGGGEDGEEKQVYHYRGSVYEVVGNEPVEWLQQQPERWKRKRSGEVEAREEVVQSRGSGTGSRSGGGKRKREFKDEAAMKAEEMDERRVWKSPRKSAVNCVKRRRVSGDGYREQQEVEDADTISVSMSRRRKNQSHRESPGKNGFMPANNPAPFSVAEIKENRAQMAVNEVLQLAAINSRIHILAQQHKKMRQELEVLRHERETHSSHESDPSKSLEIPDSEGSFTDPIPASRSMTTTTSPTEDTSPTRKEDTTTATTTSTTTTRSLSTSSSTSSYATATSPRQPTPISHAANPGTKTTPRSTEPPPLQQPTVTSSPPTKTSLPPSQHLPSSAGPTPLPRESRKGQQKKTWAFLTDLQRGIEEGREYDRAEVGVFALMKERAGKGVMGRGKEVWEVGMGMGKVERRRESERERVEREIEVLRGWEEV
ncbi:hypothetical protein KC315_g87 [Hortaea werneckii]|nr:hypothetical protein KC315_g87 [Hortaea werneckii]KAI7370728.1 hypothetical protein KC354_g1065 [Hortaea werneckii]